MDSLLRSHLGAGGGDFGDGVEFNEAEHLDADELAAFVENATPAPARSFYVSHLADCESCRRQVANLTRASGIGYELEKRSAAAQAENGARAKTLIERLAAFFSPRVFRYAAPALAIALIGTVTFIILRSNGGNEPIARRTDAPTIQDAPAASESSEAEGQDAGANEAKQADANANQVALNQGDADVEGRREDSAGASAARTESASPSGRSALGGGTENVAADQAELPKAATPAPPPAASSESATIASHPAPAPSVPAASENARGGSVEPKATDASRVKSDVDERSDENRANREEATLPTLGMSAPGARDESRNARRARQSPSPSRTESAHDSQPASETRTVAGRRFQRRGGLWVDVNYKQGMPLSRVRRGTESFRALVADMPEIGRAADLLSEEFIIVVNGRAYRIR